MSLEAHPPVGTIAKDARSTQSFSSSSDSHASVLASELVLCVESRSSLRLRSEWPESRSVATRASASNEAVTKAGALAIWHGASSAATYPTKNAGEASTKAGAQTFSRVAASAMAPGTKAGDDPTKAGASELQAALASAMTTPGTKTGALNDKPFAAPCRNVKASCCAGASARALKEHGCTSVSVFTSACKVLECSSGNTSTSIAALYLSQLQPWKCRTHSATAHGLDKVTTTSPHELPARPTKSRTFSSRPACSNTAHNMSSERIPFGKLWMHTFCDHLLPTSPEPVHGSRTIPPRERVDAA
mmetsp:Transcript_33497/g.92557  ORF Transcript_33497/g.92557 Transcript_33497/m.92557 type:complete len:303 (+) Transcript_33497:138-1046(+)